MGRVILYIMKTFTFTTYIMNIFYIFIFHYEVIQICIFVPVLPCILNHVSKYRWLHQIFVIFIVFVL